MGSFAGKIAVVIGASSGVGKATALALANEGARVFGIARRADGLAALSGSIETIQADAADPATAERVLRETRPDIVVLAGGTRPRMAPIDELSWESFSETWNNDTKATFLFAKAAVTMPLAPGSHVIFLSSGAAINGSHLSGGYAGAKRMQWLLAGYLQQLSNKRGLGIRFSALLPKQLIEGSEIAANAANAYGAALGISGADFMKRFGVPLTAEKCAQAVLKILRQEVESGANAFAVTGTALEALA
jgi:NAD(P)-dependent dehydrogenase (short-subunit alcohol dehydrogenase family)